MQSNEHPLPPKDLTAGIVLVHNDGERYRLLCVRNFDTWDFPKGPVREDEDVVEAATEEVRAATGIENPAFHWGEDYRETVPFEDGRVARYFLAESATDDVQLDVPGGAGADEDYEYRWVTVEEAEDLLPPRLGIILEWAVGKLARGRPH